MTLLASGMILAGCASPDTRVASLSNGASKVFTAPPCAIKATTRIGQRWISVTTERGVSALGWKRPQKACEPDAQPAPAAKPAPLKRRPWWPIG